MYILFGDVYRIYFSQRLEEIKQKNKVDGWMVIYGFINIAADHDVVQRALWSRAVDSERLDLLYPHIIQKCSYIPCALSALPLPIGSVLMWHDCVRESAVFARPRERREVQIGL